MRKILYTLLCLAVSLFYFELIYRWNEYAIKNKICDRLATTPPTCERAEDAFICIFGRVYVTCPITGFSCSSAPQNLFSLVECVVFIILPLWVLIWPDRLLMVWWCDAAWWFIGSSYSYQGIFLPARSKVILLNSMLKLILYYPLNECTNGLLVLYTWNINEPESNSLSLSHLPSLQLHNTLEYILPLLLFALEWIFMNFNGLMQLKLLR